MADTYYTITKEGEATVREKMSRFLSFAMHVDDVDEAQQKIKEFQNRFHDARHVCWAYIIGSKSETWQLNDNGEPSGTAGKPILGQIKSKGLTFALVVVVRYFGGIKLGTSGLIQAYKQAAKEALDNCGIVECHEMKETEIQFSYENMNGIMKIIKSKGVSVLEKEFGNICRMKISVREDDNDRIRGLLTKAFATIL